MKRDGIFLIALVIFISIMSMYIYPSNAENSDINLNQASEDVVVEQSASTNGEEQLLSSFTLLQHGLILGFLLICGLLIILFKRVTDL